VAFAMRALSSGTTSGTTSGNAAGSSSGNSDNGQGGIGKVEVAVLERSRRRRAFRRIEGAALAAVLPAGAESGEKPDGEKGDPEPKGDSNGDSNGGSDKG
jgi:proteasome alpha subunit